MLMADLIAQGTKPTDRWRRALPPGQRLVIGRRGDWAVPWDTSVSRQHAEIELDAGLLKVRCLPFARNPVFLRGEANDSFHIAVGDHFVIGDTTFLLSDERANVTLELPPPQQAKTFRIDDLKKHRFRDADQRITLLSRLAELIAGARDDRQLFSNLANLLLAGVPRATAVAFVADTGEVDLDTDESGRSVELRKDELAEDVPLEILHWDRRRVAEQDFRPSERLIRESLRSATAVVHMWSAAGNPQFTAAEEADWAFCTPLPHDSSQRLAIYMSGQFRANADKTSDPSADYSSDLQDDLKFTEVVAASLASALENRHLQQRQAGLRQFFSPVVLDALTRESPDAVLAPRETEVSVLFCDLRGFARQSERQADDLLGLLDRVSEALGVTTQHILAHGGVVGDLQGDAVMGFWGWPLAQENAAALAARAALAIRLEFQRASAQTERALAGFEVGIGLASGRAVAGKIGTEEVVKVTVFGPVPNLAARLEGMTKIIRAPILMDQATTAQVRSQLGPEEARVRRLAVVRPYGLKTAVEVSELLPPEVDYPQLSDANIGDYENALAALIRGDWAEAFDRLHRVPADDLAKDFLTVLIAQHDRTAPSGWDGVIQLASKE
ncbi:MAG: adenylate/guanylate cyclase domain-containing protein [Planctomycetota bacterium]|nr:MAG: adenylate/guanylate cyclase domain-containing protein [Planctomycetota bacterium]REJ92739.1 MAG: adenylate/guanylate cyclase domain-containing protein [Planctomycetota bacterium]